MSEEPRFVALLTEAEKDIIWRRADSWVSYRWHEGKWWAGPDPRAPFPGIWTLASTKDGIIRCLAGFIAAAAVDGGTLKP